MGLDMYLSKKTYVKNWRHTAEDKKHTVTIKGDRSKEIKSDRVTHIQEEVGYWRKANQIHKWFVENIQEGVDDCRSYYVQASKLEGLLENCKTVLEDDSKAERLLPNQSGFFFGSTGYDEWYFEQLEDTVKIIGGIISEMKENESEYEFYYQSSW